MKKRIFFKCRASLETKIPPLIVTIFFLILIYFSKNLIEVFSFNFQGYASLFFLGISLFFISSANFEFLKYKTTVNPIKPKNATSMIQTGVFKYTRNPIYFSFFNLLICLSVYLGSFLGLLVTSLFVIYMNKFQILPEEKAMQKLFGEDYTTYCSLVRRWI